MAETLGETFKDRRRQLGVSLAEVEDAIHVRAKILSDIEEGNYDRLPNPGYVRNYVSSYAKYLELDPAQMLTMYHAETGHGRFHRIELPDEAVKPRHEQHAISWRAALTVVAVVGLISLVIWGVAQLVQGPETPPPIPEQTATSTPAAGTEATPQVTPETPPVNELVSEPFALKIVVDSGKSSWLSIKVDGDMAYEGTLNGPATKEYEVTKTAILKVGKPEFVTVYRDGTPVTVPLKNGIGVTTLSATKK